MTQLEYHSSDPFFIVRCRRCRAEYWSTRRENATCAKCGSSDTETKAPEHTIDLSEKKK